MTTEPKAGFLFATESIGCTSLLANNFLELPYFLESTLAIFLEN